MLQDNVQPLLFITFRSEFGDDAMFSNRRRREQEKRRRVDERKKEKETIWAKREQVDRGIAWVGNTCCGSLLCNRVLTLL